MPTAIATLDRARSVRELARAVYAVTDATPPGLLRRAESALLRANPRLGEPGGFRRGAVVVIPAVPGLAHAEAVRSTAADGNGPTRETRLRLEALSSRVDDGFRRSAQRKREALERLEDDRFRALLDEALPDARELVDQARRQLATDLDAEPGASETLQANITAALEALEQLETRAGRTVGDPNG